MDNLVIKIIKHKEKKLRPIAIPRHQNSKLYWYDKPYGADHTNKGSVWPQPVILKTLI